MAISLLKSFPAPPVDVSEILRYACLRVNSPKQQRMIEECIKEAEPHLSYKVCYTFVKCSVDGNEVTLDDEKIVSDALSKNLCECDEAVMFSCTVGIGIDRLIEKNKSLSLLKTMLMHAVGVERVEGLANAFCDFLEEEVAKKGKSIKPRFSPGYGDFKLENQRLFFEKLESTKLLGLTLSESKIMSPSKSVTAIVGITDKNNKKKKKVTCQDCLKDNCKYRR
ncbi:MAG: hypothetical protein IKB56_03390 [Clostridia bacterium]|nr:hypothetical protein [Clostridia bacterium]